MLRRIVKMNGEKVKENDGLLFVVLLGVPG